MVHISWRISPTNLANFPPLVVLKHIDYKDITPDDSDDSSTVKITPHYVSIKAGEETYISSIYIPEKYKPSPW